MDTIAREVTLYDVLLASTHFDDDQEIYRLMMSHIQQGPPKQAQSAQSTVAHLLEQIISLRKFELLQQLLHQGIAVEGSAVKAAVALPLELAKSCLELLFAHGWDINKAFRGVEPPVLSIALHNPQLTMWLLERGADPNASCDTDVTPLSIAVQEAPIPIVQLLLQHAQHQRNGHLVLFAVHRDDVDEAVDLIKILHQYGKPIDDVAWQDAKSFPLRGFITLGTPLYYACMEDKVPVALTLLDLGADPDKPCMAWNQNVGPTPRQVAMQRGGPIAARMAASKKLVPSVL